MKVKSYLCVLLVVVMVLAGLCGCSAKSEAVTGNSADRFYDGLYDSASDSVIEMEQSESATSALSSVISNQKLVRTMDVDAETDDMDALLAELDRKVSGLGGYIQNKSTRNGSSTATRRYRHAEMTIRVSADRLNELIDHISGKTNVVSYHENADDITLRYVATQSRVTALETEQQRLLELLAQAENMTDLLMIEERLTNVRTELEEVTSQMRLYDNMVDYGTVRLSVTEVQEFTATQEQTIWQRIGSGLTENWQNLCDSAEAVFVFVIVSLPYLVPIGIVTVITVVTVKLATRKIKKRDIPPVSGEKTE